MAVPEDTRPGTGRELLTVAGHLQRRWTDALRRRGLTQHQHAVLAALAEHGRQGQGDLARRVGVDPRNIGPVLDSLGPRRLLVSRTDPADRRRRVLQLSDRGAAVARELAEELAGVEAEVFAALGPGDRAELGKLLAALRAGLDGD